MDCIFCRIVDGSIPSSKVYEDELILAFKDINPIAPVHVVIIPKVHISSAKELKPSDSNLIGHIFLKSQEIAAICGIEQNGYRIINNCGRDAGQTVNHIHFHLIGGKTMEWP